MKKLKILFSLSLIFGASICFINSASAASGKAVVHYADAAREDTCGNVYYSATSMGYTVECHKAWDNALILDQHKSFKIIVMHTHGAPGIQAMHNNTYLVGKSGNGTNYKAISSLASGATNSLRMAIYFGCSTGDTSSIYGDLPGQTVSKGAQAAVAWKVTTYVPEVNAWVSYFFSKAKTETIVESYRHADYWLRFWHGNNAGDRMQLNRTERGNIYGYIN